LTQGPAGRFGEGWRLPASELEQAVAVAAGQLLGDKPAVATAVDEVGVAVSQLAAILETTREWQRKLQSEVEAASALTALIERVELRHDGLCLSLNLPLPASTSGDQPLQAAAIVTRFVPMRMKRRGVELRLVIEGERPQATKVDLTLLKAPARAHCWFDDLAARRAPSLAALAAQQGKSARYVGRQMQLAFLSPPIVEAIVAGRQPAELTVEVLTKRMRLAYDWGEQQRTLGSYAL
jgi:site-specific DNA recombinase